jgi:hypothetical protein
VEVWRSPRRDNVLLQDAPFSLEGANTSLRGASYLFIAQFGFEFENLL